MREKSTGYLGAGTKAEQSEMMDDDDAGSGQPVS